MGIASSILGRARRFIVPVLSVLLVSLWIASCGNKAGENQKPGIQFTETSHSFLEMIPGEKRKHTFEYTNTGNAPLLILNIESECGCTVPSWSKDMLAPGEKTTMTVYYDSQMMAPGIRKSHIRVISNADEVITLTIEAEVLRINYKINQ
jgi:hypothetical protein